MRGWTPRLARARDRRRVATIRDRLGPIAANWIDQYQPVSEQLDRIDRDLDELLIVLDEAVEYLEDEYLDEYLEEPR